MDYMTEGGENVTLDWVLDAIKEVVASNQLTWEDVLKVIDKIEEDPLCPFPHISKDNKKRKLTPLKKILAALADIDET